MNRDVIHFADNTAANGAAVNGFSPAPDIARMQYMYQLRLAELRTRTWVEYVPSRANIADDPTRDRFDRLEQLSAERIEFEFPPLDGWDSSSIVE